MSFTEIVIVICQVAGVAGLVLGFWGALDAVESLRALIVKTQDRDEQRLDTTLHVLDRMRLDLRELNGKVAGSEVLLSHAVGQLSDLDTARRASEEVALSRYGVLSGALERLERRPDERRWVDRCPADGRYVVTDGREWWGEAFRTRRAANTALSYLRATGKCTANATVAEVES